jgi:hypothetical protein
MTFDAEKEAEKLADYVGINPSMGRKASTERYLNALRKAYEAGKIYSHSGGPQHWSDLRRGLQNRKKTIKQRNIQIADLMHRAEEARNSALEEAAKVAEKYQCEKSCVGNQICKLAHDISYCIRKLKSGAWEGK